MYTIMCALKLHSHTQTNTNTHMHTHTHTHTHTSVKYGHKYPYFCTLSLERLGSCTEMEVLWCVAIVFGTHWEKKVLCLRLAQPKLRVEDGVVFLWDLIWHCNLSWFSGYLWSLNHSPSISVDAPLHSPQPASLIQCPSHRQSHL